MYYLCCRLTQSLINMTANERYEKAWNAYLVLLNRDSKSRLTPFLRNQHIHVRGMQKWMSEKGLSVQSAKLQIRMCQEHARKESLPPCPETTGTMFLPVESSTPAESHDLLSGVSFVFPDGTHVSIKSGSAKAVISLMKLYQKEELLCLE